MTRLTRRQFLGATAATTAAAAIVPRHVLGGPGFVAPSDKINIGYIGCGSQGLRLLMPALENPDVHLLAVCDPNRKSDDYPTWGPGELRGKISRFLDDPDWGAGARGGLCGREVGREVVNRHYAKQTTSGRYDDCRGYADFREMLAEESDLDAVYIMTPEHLHATIALQAMNQGKHVITHKSLANVLHEARLVRDAAQRTGVATHMHCSASSSRTPMLAEWIGSGIIGPVREVHNWTNRPFWPQGMTRYPDDRPPVPEGFDWDLWLGPVPDRPYSPAFTHAVFRGWIDFGTGCLGDVGNYSFHQIFSVMKLGAPLTVQANASFYYSITDYTWHKEVNTVSFPRASTVRWTFPERDGLPPMELFWYDGGMRPRTPDALAREGVELGDEGLMFVGDDGVLLAGREPRLYPSNRFGAFAPPPETLERPLPELENWLRACRDGTPTNASFEHVYDQTETILIGNVALRHDGKLHWDSERMTFPDAPEADALLTREYRPGWEL